MGYYWMQFFFIMYCTLSKFICFELPNILLIGNLTKVAYAFVLYLGIF